MRTDLLVDLLVEMRTGSQSFSIEVNMVPQKGKNPKSLKSFPLKVHIFVCVHFLVYETGKIFCLIPPLLLGLLFKGMDIKDFVEIVISRYDH